MSGRVDPHHRLAAQAAKHLRQNGFSGSRDEDWAGGHRGVQVPLEGGHTLELGPPQEGDPNWQARIVRPYDDPHYEQEGLKLGAPNGPRLPHAQPTSSRYLGVASMGHGDDHYNTAFLAHPRDVPARVTELLGHPQVVNALKADHAKMRAERGVRGQHPRPLSGDQFGGA